MGKNNKDISISSVLYVSAASSLEEEVQRDLQVPDPDLESEDLEATIAMLSGYSGYSGYTENNKIVNASVKDGE